MGNTKTLSNGMMLRQDAHVNVVSKDGGVYFDRIGEEERSIVSQWLKITKGADSRQVEFVWRVREALESVKGVFYIANLEPSVDETGRLYYEAGQSVAQGYNFYEWLLKAKKFLPECDSDIATIYQYDLWLAYRIATKKWNLAEICKIPAEETGEIEVSGIREVGGARDGVGNTQKIVVYNLFNYVVSGYCRETNEYLPVSYIIQQRQSGVNGKRGQVAILALNKVPAIT